MDPDVVEANAVRHRPPRRGTGRPVHVRDSLSELADQLSVQEVSELIYRRTTSQQLEDILSLKRTQEADGGPPLEDETERLRNRADPATVEALEANWWSHAALMWRAMGVDDDIIGAVLVDRLIAGGIDADGAGYMVVRAGIGWAPRSDEECWRRVAMEMIRDGFTPAQVQDAIASVRVREAVAA